MRGEREGDSYQFHQHDAPEPLHLETAVWKRGAEYMLEYSLCMICMYSTVDLVG